MIDAAPPTLLLMHSATRFERPAPVVSEKGLYELQVPVSEDPDVRRLMVIRLSLLASGVTSGELRLRSGPRMMDEILAASKFAYGATHSSVVVLTAHLPAEVEKFLVSLRVYFGHAEPLELDAMAFGERVDPPAP